MISLCFAGAISAYVGLQGGGKTFEVVSAVILPALADGVRVVTNIRGIHEDKMLAYLMVERKLPRERLGSVVSVAREAPVVDQHFFYSESDARSVVQPGDLVVLDECWQLLGKGKKLAPRVMEFFRMHRQYVSVPAGGGAGRSCEIVLITQAIGDFQTDVRSVIEKHFLMTKWKHVGSSKTYDVKVFRGFLKQKDVEAQETFTKRYDKAIFPFYESYSGAGGVEREVDKRFNALNNVWLKAIFAVGVPGIFLGLYASYYFTFGAGGFAAKAKRQELRRLGLASSSVAAVPLARRAAPGTDGLNYYPVGAVSGIVGAPAVRWRVLGYYELRGDVIYLLSSGSGPLRYVFGPTVARVGHNNVELVVDGQVVTSYGSLPNMGPSGLGAVLAADNGSGGTTLHHPYTGR